MAYAPGHKLCDSREGFDSNVFAKLAKVEAGHFWFRSRNRLIIWALDRYFSKARRFLELGCGTGFVLSGIEKLLTPLFLVGCDIYPEAFIHAKQRLHKVRLMLADALHLPFNDTLEVIGAFDVLEHISDDAGVLKEIHFALRPGGGIILMAPQHKFMWSYTDIFACHVRRYEARELKEKVRESGFEIIDMVSFVSILLPVVMMARLIGSKQSVVQRGEPPELNPPRFLNTIFKRILDFEYFLIRCGIRFPWGTSLMIVARKI